MTTTGLIILSRTMKSKSFLNCSDKINIPEGIEEEFKLAEFLTKIVDYYLRVDCGNFDLYLETKLTEKYGGNT